MAIIDATNGLGKGEIVIHRCTGMSREKGARTGRKNLSALRETMGLAIQPPVHPTFPSSQANARTNIDCPHQLQ